MCLCALGCSWVLLVALVCLCVPVCALGCEQVAKTLPHESLVQMEEMYKLSNVKNSEIRMRWCMLGTLSPYQY
eukprot:COSAG06_NODE_2858_length_6166_cov_5.402011_7_plen_73_part_00